MAIILADFDQLTRKHRVISGEDAVASHAGIFPELGCLEGVLALADIDHSEKAAVAEKFACLWSTHLSSG